MVDPPVEKIRHKERIITAKIIRVNDAFPGDFLRNERLERLGLRNRMIAV